MKITSVVVFVSIDDGVELRQVLIQPQYSKALIAMIENGMFHDEDVLISEKPTDSIILDRKVYKNER